MLTALLLAFPWIGSFAAPGPTPTSTDWEVGSGLVTMGAHQTVSGQAYWDTFCPVSQGYCMNPSGLTYIPSAQLVLVTEQTSYGPNPGGVNAFLEFSTLTLGLTAPVPLGCRPYVPFYPGTGVDVYVPCWNNTLSLLAIDVQTLSVVASMPVPPNLYGTSMVYDPADGMIYWGTVPNHLISVDPVNNTIVGITLVDGATFPAGEGFSSSYGLVYDPATNALILPSSSAGLLAVNPVSGAIERIMTLGAPADTVVLDSATNQIFVATSLYNTSSVDVFNAATYAWEETIAIPDCVYNLCAEPNEVNQVLLDPGHGDAYFVTTVGLFSVNLTTMAMSTVMADYGDGPQETGVYVPSLDAIFGTYEPILLGPGYVALLHHATAPYLTMLFWMPTSVALLLLAGVVGLVLAVFRPGYISPEELAVFDPPVTDREDDVYEWNP